jgi:hypothetical protein
VDVLEHPVDPAGPKRSVTKGCVQDVTPDEPAPVSECRCPRGSFCQKGTTRVKSNDFLCHGKRGRKAGEINPRPAAGIQNPFRFYICHDPDAVALDLVEERDARDEVKAPVARVRVTGCIDIAEAGGKELALHGFFPGRKRENQMVICASAS